MSKQKPERLSAFRPQAQNANLHTERGLWMLDNSIAQEGWIGAITTAADGEVFDGSARLETVYTRLGEDVEPIVVESDGTRPVILKRIDIPTADDPRAKKLAIAANRIAQVDLQWDPNVLTELNDEVDLSGLFTDAELSELIDAADNNELNSLDGQANEQAEENEQEVSDLVANADSGRLISRVKPGEIWKLGRHYIACADSTKPENIQNLMQTAGVSAVDMVWSDPPYGISVVSKDGSLGGNTKGKYSQILGDKNKSVAYSSFAVYQKFKTAIQCWWKANHYASVVPDSSCWIVWDKQGGKSVTFADCELAWTNVSQPARIFTHIWDGFRRDSERGEMRVHPTQKPVALFSWFFDKYGSDDNVILDPFLGSGGSIIAAQAMDGGRRVIGFELSPEYCEVICQRFEKLTGISAKLIKK